MGWLQAGAAKKIIHLESAGCREMEVSALSSLLQLQKSQITVLGGSGNGFLAEWIMAASAGLLKAVSICTSSKIFNTMKNRTHK